MTRKDYELIAAVIATQWEDTSARSMAARAFARQLASINPRFDRDRFLRACLRVGERWYHAYGQEWISDTLDS